MNPPCQQCGAPLQWVAQYQQWYCARCQTYAQQAQPQQQAAYPQQPAGKGKGVLIFAIVAVLVVGGGVAAVFLLGGGDDGPEGSASVEELVDATIEALREGDGARLLRLHASPEMMKKVFDCPDETWEAGLDEDDRKRYAGAIASVWSTIDFDAEISEKRDAEELDAGDDMGDCKVTEPMAMQTIFVAFHYEDDGDSGIHEPSVMAVRIDDQWYSLGLGVDVPSPFLGKVESALAEDEGDDDDEDSTEEKDEEHAAILELRALRDRACACKDEACALEVGKDLTDLAERYQDDEPSEGDLKQVEATVEELSKCLQEVHASSAPAEVDEPPPEPSPAAEETAESEETAAAKPGSTGVPACDRYIEIMERFASCEAIPEGSRDALRQGFEQAKEGFEQFAAMPESAKQAAGKGCAQGADALEQSLKSFGCAP